MIQDGERRRCLYSTEKRAPHPIVLIGVRSTIAASWWHEMKIEGLRAKEFLRCAGSWVTWAQPHYISDCRCLSQTPDLYLISQSDNITSRSLSPLRSDREEETVLNPDNQVGAPARHSFSQTLNCQGRFAIRRGEQRRERVFQIERPCAGFIRTKERGGG